MSEKIRGTIVQRKMWVRRTPRYLSSWHEAFQSRVIQNIGLSIMIYIGGLGRKYKSQSIHVAKIGGENLKRNHRLRGKTMIFGKLCILYIEIWTQFAKKRRTLWKTFANHYQFRLHIFSCLMYSIQAVKKSYMLVKVDWWPVVGDRWT